MLVADVLRSKGQDVVQTRPSESVLHAVRMLAQHRIGAVVVTNQWMKSVGIISERDIVNAIARDGAAALNAEVRDLMSSPIITCSASDRIDAALALMTLKKIRHLPVVEHGELAGIISIGDLVKRRLDEKELEASVLLDLSRMHV